MFDITTHDIFKLVRVVKNPSTYHNLIFLEVSQILYLDINRLENEVKNICRKVFLARKALGSIKGGSPVQIQYRRAGGELIFFYYKFDKDKGQETNNEIIVFKITPI